MSNRPNDHFLFQFGYTNWAGTPDTINTSGFSKSFNVYFMFDFPFKTNPKISVAFGAGVGSDHMLFSKYTCWYQGSNTYYPFYQYL